MNLLDDFVTVSELAKQIGKSERTVQRMIARRVLTYTDFGNKKLIHVPSSREALLSRVVKPVGERRGRR